MCAYIQKLHAHTRRNLDFLSFLTKAADYLVGFAKTFAGLIAALFIMVIARCLPKRICKYFSACATLVISFALFKNSIQQFSVFTAKSMFLHLTIACLTALTLLFCVYVATCLVGVGSARFMLNARRNVRYDSRHVKSFALRNDVICASVAYLSISPICLQ